MSLQKPRIHPSHNLYNSTCLAPAEVLTQMMSGFRVTQLIYVAAELGIADLVQEAPKSADELAYLVGVDREALYRVMHGLASIGVFSQREGGCFAQTPYSYYLQTGVPDSLRPRILFWGQEWNQHAWSQTLQTVKTGESGFNAAFGVGFFESLAQHSQVARRFDEHIASRTTAFAQAVVTAYDFSQFDNIAQYHRGGPFLKMSTKKVAIVIPALNEEAALSHLLAELPHHIAEWIIVADNGSTDATATVAQAAGAIIASEPMRGYGRACLKGLKTARTLGADIVVFMDGDGSDDPADLPIMLSPIREGRADLVIGSRVTKRSERGAIPPQARLGNWLVSRLIRLLYGLHLHDIGSFRVIPCSLLEALEMSEMTFGWPVEMLVKAARVRYRILELPIHYRHRTHGRSKVAGTLSGSIKAAYAMLRTTLITMARNPVPSLSHNPVGADLSCPPPIDRPRAHRYIKRRTHV